MDGTVDMYIYKHISALYISKRIHLYIYLLERSTLCSLGVPGSEVLKASNEFILANYKFASTNNSL